MHDEPLHYSESVTLSTYTKWCRKADLLQLAHYVEHPDVLKLKFRMEDRSKSTWGSEWVSVYGSHGASLAWAFKHDGSVSHSLGAAKTPSVWSVLDFKKWKHYVTLCTNDPFALLPVLVNHERNRSCESMLQSLLGYTPLKGGGFSINAGEQGSRRDWFIQNNAPKECSPMHSFVKTYASEQALTTLLTYVPNGMKLDIGGLLRRALKQNTLDATAAVMLMTVQAHRYQNDSTQAWNDIDMSVLKRNFPKYESLRLYVDTAMTLGTFESLGNLTRYAQTSHDLELRTRWIDTMVGLASNYLNTAAQMEPLVTDEFDFSV